MTSGVAARLDGASRSFGSRQALASTSFAIEPGEVLGLLGPNGAGKTTTMRLLTGFLRPSSGRVMVGDIDMAADPVAARNLLGYMPERVALPPHLPVVTYLRSCARLRGIGRAVAQAEVDRVVALAGLDEVASRRCGQLSHGFTKRVGLGQALLGDPPILILDEPTTGMDPRQVAAARTLIARLGRQHAVLLSSHLLSEVSNLCRRVVVLDHGEVITQAAVADLTRGERRIVLRVDDPDRAVGIVRAVPGVTRAERHGRDVRVWGDGDELPARVARAVVDAGLALAEQRVESSSLEDAYLRLVSE